MRIAFTSSDGAKVDQHFGMATSFHLWEVGPKEAKPLGTVTALTTAGDEEDRISARANAIAGCTLVYTLQIGGPAAAKLVARKIHPMKTQEEVQVSEVIEKLQQVLQGTPPPWLRKAMNPGAAASFLEDDEDPRA